MKYAFTAVFVGFCTLAMKTHGGDQFEYGYEDRSPVFLFSIPAEYSRGSLYASVFEAVNVVQMWVDDVEVEIKREYYSMEASGYSIEAKGGVFTYSILSHNLNFSGRPGLGHQRIEIPKGAKVVRFRYTVAIPGRGVLPAVFEARAVNVAGLGG